MAKLDYLITFAGLKETVDLPDRIGDELLKGKLTRAQEMLSMIMGYSFYIDFLNAYKNDGTTPLSSAYAALHPYVKRFLAWQSYEYYTIDANFLPTRAGFRVHSEENSVAASDAQMAIVIKNAKQEAQYWKAAMVEFLNANAENYPLYSVSCGTNTTGNTFHVSAVRNRHRHGKNCNCGCHD